MKKAIISFLFLALGIAAASAQCSTPAKTTFLASSDWGYGTIYVTTCGDFVHIEAALTKVATTPGAEYVVSAAVPQEIQRTRPANGAANVFTPATRVLTNSGAQVNASILAYAGGAKVGDKLYINFAYYK